MTEVQDARLARDRRIAHYAELESEYKLEEELVWGV
jgi:hypothetical protein